VLFLQVLHGLAAEGILGTAELVLLVRSPFLLLSIVPTMLDL